MLHEEETTLRGPIVSFDCSQCRTNSALAHLIEYIRKPYYCGIPLGTEKKILIKCDACRAEFFTHARSFGEIMALGPGHLNSRLLKLKSPLFPKILIVIMAMTWFFPLFGPMIWFFLRGYDDYIRGWWRKVYRISLLLTILAHLIWIPYIGHRVGKGE